MTDIIGNVCGSQLEGLDAQIHFTPNVRDLWQHAKFQCIFCVTKGWVLYLYTRVLTLLALLYKLYNLCTYAIVITYPT